MRIITKARLKAFWETPGCRDSEGALRTWHTHVGHRSVAWKSFNEVRTTIASAGLVGNCVVFNIGGKKYRLVTRILYRIQKVFVLKVMTHEEYDENKWKGECGCFAEAPLRKRKGSEP